MTYVTIPVRKVDESFTLGVFVVSLFFAFTVGATLGILLTGTRSLTDANSQLGAIAELTENAAPAVGGAPTPTDETPTALPSENISDDTLGESAAGTDEQTETTLESVPIEYSAEEIVAAAENIISDENALIARITDQLERVRSLSVGVVAEFEQNCGNWRDDCATPFQRRLDEYNRTYEELANELSFHIAVRTAAQSTISENQ